MILSQEVEDVWEIGEGCVCGRRNEEEERSWSKLEGLRVMGNELLEYVLKKVGISVLTGLAVSAA